jgi:hypothetical protein
MGTEIGGGEACAAGLTSASAAAAQIAARADDRADR